MGKYFQLFGMVESKEMDDYYANMKPAQRQAEIDKLVGSANTIGIYSPESFPVEFAGEIITIEAGWHQYSAGFAVWALQKYGKGSRYGQTYRTVDGKMIANPELLDENPAGEEAPKERRSRTKAEAE